MLIDKLSIKFMSQDISQLVLQGTRDQNETKTILLLFTILLLDTVNFHANTIILKSTTLIMFRYYAQYNMIQYNMKHNNTIPLVRPHMQILTKMNKICINTK